MKLLWGHFEFDNRERGSLRIVQNREASDSRNIVSGFHDTAAKAGYLLNHGIAIVNREVDQPVRRNRSHFRSDLEHAAGAPVTVLEHGVFHWSKALGVSGPAESVR